MQRIQNPFWNHVLMRYKKFYSEFPLVDVCEFVSECIHYGIKNNQGQNDNSFFFKEWMDNIFLIGHLINTDGKIFIMSFK